jgi:hypothetical protein
MLDTANSQKVFVPEIWGILNLPETEKMPEDLKSITKLVLVESIGKK